MWTCKDVLEPCQDPPLEYNVAPDLTVSWAADPVSLPKPCVGHAGQTLPFPDEHNLNPSRRPHEAAAVDYGVCGTVRCGTSAAACIDPGAGSHVFSPRYVLGIRPVRSCASAQRD